ncbi:hypothetical protein [Thalassospira xiamenensis]|nr:hypothetical protein [Thalassospira xiamenensis]
MRARAHEAVHEHSILPPAERGNIAPKLRALFAQCAEDVRIETRFHCAYGVNIHLGRDVFINVGCTILDTASVIIQCWARMCRFTARSITRTRNFESSILKSPCR